MAEKEIKIKVTTETDVSNLEDLKSVLEDINNTGATVGEVLSSQLDEVADSADEASSSMEDLNASIEDIDSESIDEAATSADELGDSADEASSSMDDLNNSIEDIDSESINEASSSADELGDSADEASSSMEDLNASIEDIDSESIDEAATSADELGDSADEASSSMDDLNNSIEDIDSESINEASSSADELGDSADEASNNVDGLSDSIDNINGSNFQEAASGADELADSADNAKSSVDGLGESLGVIESASMMGLAEGIGAYGDSAENMAQQMNTAAISVGQLATQAGIAEPQMVSLINNISNATFPQAEAMQYVQVLNQMGVSAGQLGASATDLDRINDAFGIGSDKVVQLSSNLYALGVPMDNIGSSFNALGYAQSNVVGGVDKFNTVLQRLGPSFSEYGYNVDQAAVITAAATQKWGGGRKALSNLSSALKDANGDTKALEQALGLQPGALDNATAATQQYEGQLQSLADEEAEHKTWLDQLGAAWEDISLSLSPILSPLASFVGLIGEIGQTALAINSIVTLAQSIKSISAVGSVLSGLSGIVSGVGGAFTSLFGVLLDNPITLVIIAVVALVAALIYLYYTNEDVRKAIDGFLSWLGGAWDAAVSAVVGTIEWLQGAWQNTVDFLTNTPQMISDAIVGAFNWLRDSIIGIFTGIYDVIMGTWQGVVDWLVNGAQWISDGVTGAFQWIIDLIYGTLVGAFEWLSSTWQAVVDWFTQGGQTIQDTLGGAFQWLSDTWNMVVNTIMTYAPLVAQILFVMATGGVGAIILLVANFMGMPNQVGGALQNVIGRVVSFAGNLVNNLRNAAVNAVSQFASGIGRLGDALKQELQGMLNDAANFVGQIGQIMWNAAVNAWNNFLSGLQRKSPGKMMREFRAEMSGIVSTAEETKAPLGDAMFGLAKTAVNSWGNPNLKYTIELEKLSIADNNTGGFDNASLESLLARILDALQHNQGVGSVTLNHYGDVDKEEKLQEILDFIIRAMNFDNETAGRTV